MPNIIGKIAWKVIRLIDRGEIAPGELLPSEAELGALTGAGKFHVYHALKQLQQLEIIRRRQRGGSAVLRKPYPHEVKTFLNRSSDRICLLNHLSPEIYDFAHIHYNARLLEPLKAGLEAAGWNLEIHDLGALREPEEYRKKLESICAGGVFALIVISASSDFHLFTKLLSGFHDNVFIFNRGETFEDFYTFNQVSVNNFNSGMIAAEAAVRAGAKQFFFCVENSPLISQWLNLRREGVASGIWRAFSGGVLLNNFIAGVHGSFPLKKPSPETALIAANDEVAAHYIQTGRALGLEPGRDYKIMGFENDARFRDLELTTMSPDLEAVADALLDGVRRSAAPDYSGQRSTTLISAKLLRRKTL